MDSIVAIRQSLRAFICALVGLVPVIGFFPAIYAIIVWARVRRLCREWNPAALYLNWAAVLGVIGILSSALLIFVVAINSINGSCGGVVVDYGGDLCATRRNSVGVEILFSA